MYKLGTRSKKSLEGVHPDLVRLIEVAITNSPCDFTIVEGVRTVQRQKQLYAQGRTTPGSIVTNVDGVNKKSNHQIKVDGYGHAVDLYPFFLGQVQVNHKDTIARLRDIAYHIKAVARQIGVKITWGGDWKSPYDPPHFQLG